MIVGIDHGYYAIKTKHVSFPSGIIEYDYEPYTMQNVLQYRGKYYVCGTGRQTLVKNKTSNDNYYLLTLAAVSYTPLSCPFRAACVRPYCGRMCPL